MKIVVVKAELLKIFRDLWQNCVCLLADKQELKRGMLLLLLDPLYQIGLN